MAAASLSAHCSAWRRLAEVQPRIFTLEAGDLITTGTPPGVGLGMNPPQFLKAGDVVELGIEGLGSSRQQVKAYAGV